MNIADLTASQFLGVIGGFLGIGFFAIKYLLDHSFNQQKELKELEAKNIDYRFGNMIEKFDRDTRDLLKDINNLGSNLRGFKGSMESFQNTIAQVSLNHEKINLRVQALEVYNQGLEIKVKEMIALEILRSKSN